MFRQVTKTIFDLTVYYEFEWKKRPPLPFHEATKPRKLDKYKGPRPTPVSLDRDLFWKAADEIVEEHKDMLKEIVGPEFEAIHSGVLSDRYISGDLWAEAVLRGLPWYKDHNNDKLFDLLGGLWMARYASFAKSTENMDLTVAELDVHKQMLYFLNKRDILMESF